MTFRRLTALAALAAATLAAAGPGAVAQTAPAAAKPEQPPITRQTLEDMNMALTWLRRCPTERAYRRDAANSAELIVSTLLHIDGMTEPEHLAIKAAGRKRALAPCTDTASARMAATISARATLMLGVVASDAQRKGLLYLMSGRTDDSPCGVARGRPFDRKPDAIVVQREIERARGQVSAADADLFMGTGASLAQAITPEVCKAQEKTKLGEGLIAWQQMFSNMQDATQQVETLSYGHRNSWIWRTEAQRGNSQLRPTGVYYPCRTYAPTLDNIAVYACELKVNGPARELTAEVKPYCTDATCLKTIDAVELQLFADAKAATPLASFSGRAGADGKWTFGPEVLRTLLDPANSGRLVHVKVTGKKPDGTLVADALKLRGAPPDLDLSDLQDAVSWAFAPDSVAFKP